MVRKEEKNEVGVIHNRRMRQPDQSPEGNKWSTTKTKHDNGCFRIVGNGTQNQENRKQLTHLTSFRERTERRLSWYHPRYTHSSLLMLELGSQKRKHSSWMGPMIVNTFHLWFSVPLQIWYDMLTPNGKKIRWGHHYLAHFTRHMNHNRTNQVLYTWIQDAES